MTKRMKRPAIAVTAVAGLVALAGAAVAALVLATTVTGSVSTEVTQARASDKLLASQTEVVSESDLSCTIDVRNNGERFFVEAQADKTVLTADGGDTEVTDDLAGYCIIKATLVNNGDVPLKVTGTPVDVPQGWETHIVGDPGDADSTMAAGEVEQAKFKLVATSSAVDGPISGQVTTSPID